MFTFLSPLFLVGILAAAIPLVLHLRQSRRTKKMTFSTTRFFMDQFLRSSRMSRLKEIWLLLLRMALFALFAIALARPILMPKGKTFVTGKRCLVLVIDNSASMGCQEDGVSMFDRARQAARDLLDTLRPGDTVSIVLAARRAAGPEVLFPEPVPAGGDVRQTIDGLQPTALGTDLAGAVIRAEAVACTGPAQSREVYVLSDLQDSGWDIRDDLQGPRAGSDVLFFFVPLHPAKPSNLAITAVQYAAARPMAGIPFSIRPHVHSLGERPRGSDVALYVDGQKVGERHLEQFRNGRWATPLFHHTFGAGGWHSGYVEVLGDAFPTDNRRYFAFEVLDSIRLLVVNGAPSQVPQRDELFFLRAALSATSEGASPIRIEEISPLALAGKDLTGLPLVIMANVDSVPAAGVEKLEAFVDRGGSLLVFLGDKVNAGFYNQYLAAPTRMHGGLLPARLTAIQQNASGTEDSAFVSEVRYDHEALAPFHDPGFAGLVGIAFPSFWGLEPGEAAVLMRANTGAPLLCEKPFGKGRVMLFAATCDRDWTVLPVRPAFLPWIHRLVGYLAQEPAAAQRFYNTGDQVPLPVSAMEGLRPVAVKKPDGTASYATASGDPSAPLVFADTAQPGVYSLFPSDRPTQVRMFAVNLDGYESDFRYLDDVLADRGSGLKLSSRTSRIEAGFKELLPGRPMINFVEDPARVADASSKARRGTKLWDGILLAVLLVGLLEPWLANQISRQMMVKRSQGFAAGRTPTENA